MTKTFLDKEFGDPGLIKCSTWNNLVAEINNLFACFA